MSRHRGACRYRLARFPRVSGDEPGVIDMVAQDNAFSPRERG